LNWTPSKGDGDEEEPFSEQPTIGVLKEHQAGSRQRELYRKHGILEATFYNWRRTARASRRLKAAGAIPKRTSMAKSARMTRMPRPPIPRPGSTKLRFMGHGLMENRHGLLLDACLTLADSHAARVAGLHMIEPRAEWHNSCLG